MKRWIISLVLCLCVCLLLGGLGFRVEAADVIASGSCGDSVKWTLDSDGVLTIRGSGKMYSYLASAPWYSQRESIHSVVIEQAVTSIGDYAFIGCSSLTSITIPEGVTSIGDYAFYDCTSLTSITIPNGVTSIGNCAFIGCSSLTSITIPDGVTSIEGATFYGCSSLTSITIPESVTSIGESAFRNCSSLTSITIPESVTSIEKETFSHCSSLTSITIPNGVTSIGDYAFICCSGLASLFFNGDAPTIDTTAFLGVNAVAFYPAGNATWESKKLDYGGTLYWSAMELNTEIIATGICGENMMWQLSKGGVLTIKGSGTFKDFTLWKSYKPMIQQVIFSAAIEVPTIPANSFYGYQHLRTITLPDSVTSIGYRAFSDCTSLTSITIPEGVTSIGNYAFEYCTSLTSITIPEGVTSIGNDAFEYCTSLTGIWVGEGNPNYSNDEKGVLYNKEKTRLIQCPGGLSGTYAIPESVTSIGNYAFSGCSSLTSITIPKSVTSIGDDAFSGCSSLTSITIPESVTSIGNAAFYGCSSLTSITIPNGVTSIGDSAFSGCSSLTSITIPNSVTSIGDHAFYGCTSLTSITIPDNVTSIGGRAFEDCTSLTSITIPKRVTSIGNTAFGSCNSLKVVAFLGEKPSINSSAFAGVTADAYYPESLDSDSSWKKSGALSDYGGTLNWRPWYTLGGNLFCEHVLEDTVVPPTCTWGYTLHKCACGYSYRSDFEPGSGHDWGEPVYEWADDHSAITATRVCKRDPDHAETENGVVTSAVTKEATYDAEGEITYTATFANPAFEPQTAAVSLPHLERPAPTPAENPFTDVKSGSYYYDAVLWAVEQGVTAGTSPTTFSPDEGCTRAQVVTFLWRAAGKPDPASSESPFSDVKEGAYYYNAVLWAVENGITNGTSDKTFSPDETCTRAQIVTFLWRYEEQPAPAGTNNPFADVKPSAYFGSAVLWAVEKGITNGTSATTFDPEDTCTRAQVVTFLYRDIVKS